jgi:hypothetical protein
MPATRRPGPRITVMEIVLAQVWTFWIAVALVVPSILVVLAIIGMYVKKVVMPRYPKR